MKQSGLTMFSVVTSIVTVVLITGCNNNKKPSELQFYYYSAMNVYYSVAADNYYYSINGGASWDSLKNTKDVQPSTLGEKKVIYGSTSDIWRDNEEHRKKYNGSLLAIVNTAGTEEIEENEITEKVVAKKTRSKTVKKAPEVTEKKGIKKFFKKLFGKRKKE